MVKITQDFEFHKFSPQYGKFLIAVSDLCPATLITEVSDLYPFKDSNTIRVSVTVISEVAMLLKLQFSQELVERPLIDPEKDKIKLKIIKYKKMTTLKL